MNQDEHESFSFKKVAEAIDTTLLNGIALGEIQDYSIELVPDDRAIVVTFLRVTPINKIHVEFKLQAGSCVNGGEDGEEQSL